MLGMKLEVLGNEKSDLRELLNEKVVIEVDNQETT